ncbi:MAG: hypothetical protein AB8B53_06945 [Flavobacteriales bacterium]
MSINKSNLENNISKINDLNQSIKDKINNLEVVKGQLAESEKKIESVIEKQKNKADIKYDKSQDRIKDRLFNLNSILLGAFIAFSRFPSDDPTIKNALIIIWPMINIVMMFILELIDSDVYSEERKINRENFGIPNGKLDRAFNQSLYISLSLMISTLMSYIVLIRLLVNELT